MPASEDQIEIPRPAKGQGQWGFGYFEPLTPQERIERDDEPLDERKRVLETYSKQGFRSIDAMNLPSAFHRSSRLSPGLWWKRVFTGRSTIRSR